jgi:hypothetical protein
MQLRDLIVYTSLVAVFVAVIGFLTGPLWGLRLDYEKGQQIQLIQMTIPTFLSYVALAVVYATKGKSLPEPRGQRQRILYVVTIGALIIFIAGMIASTALYYFYANGTFRASHFNFEKYTLMISLLLSVLAVTITTISTHLFDVKQ